MTNITSIPQDRKIVLTIFIFLLGEKINFVCSSQSNFLILRGFGMYLAPELLLMYLRERYVTKQSREAAGLQSTKIQGRSTEAPITYPSSA